jgi:malate dehydrogenase (oxaloacetate-decarboxylating)
VVKAVAPTVLLGTSGEPGSFTEAVVRAMAQAVERPLVFPMSNPTSMSEAQPADVLNWTGGRALVATGSPFAPVVFEGREVRFGQANNAFVFPGIGLACLLSGVREVTDGLFAAASAALAERVTAEDLGFGSVYPRVSELRHVTAHVAAAVVKAARDEGLGRGFADEEILPAVEAAMWEPRYPKLVPSRELEPAGTR